MSIENTVPSDSHAYARFTRRLQGVFIDAIIFMVILAGSLIVAVSFASDNVGRILGITVVATWLLYEPALVSLTGGTVGHYLCNLRVVDDYGGNVSFPKALVRVLIKSLLGWYSFLAMAMTSRHQAVHDFLTKSTVQIRDFTKAQPYHFRGKRNETPEPGMPSYLRRGVFIVGYLFVCFILFTLALALLERAGLISMRCIDGYPCSWAELIILGSLWVGWAGLSIMAVTRGWKGLLWGARARR